MLFLISFLFIVLVNFQPIWTVFCGFGDIDKSKMAAVKKKMTQFSRDRRHWFILGTSKDTVWDTLSVLGMMSSTPAKSAGDARYASEDLFIH